jgi:hypothetical protein
MAVNYPEPVWATSQDVISDCSSLVYTGPTPFVMTGVLIKLLQYHFSNPDNIGNPQLKGYLWTESGSCLPGVDVSENPVEGSRINIGTSYQQDTSSVQQRPALYVQREPFRTDKISFRNMSLPSVLTSSGIYQGAAHQVTISGQHSIICAGKTGAEADNLGQEVYFRMLNYMPIIREDFRLGTFFVPGTSDVKSLPAEPNQVFYTVVRCEWAYIYRWRVIPETPVVKRLGVTYNET